MLNYRELLPVFWLCQCGYCGPDQTISIDSNLGAQGKESTLVANLRLVKVSLRCV